MTKKRVITLLLAIVMIAMLFAGCSEAETSETITSTKAEIAEGSYLLFDTTDVQEYLDFMENFDESKYEIVDISNGKYGLSYSCFNYYIVTYKTIEA